MKNRQVFRTALGFGVVCGALNVLFNLHPGSDSSFYYIPMARAFAEGDFTHAFHHLIPPLMAVLGGLVAMTGLSAFTSVKIVGAVFWLGSLFPLRRVARRMLGSDLAAQWCCLLYVLVPDLMRGAFKGNIEPLKIFFLLWLVERLLACRDRLSWKEIVPAGVSAALLGLSRNEGAAFLLPALLCILVIRSQPLLKKITACVAMTGICLALWAPASVPVYRLTGFPGITSKQASAAQKILRYMDRKPPVPAARSEDIPKIGYTFAEIDSLKPRVRLQNTLLGLMPVLAPFWIFGMIFRLRRGKWMVADTLCAGLFLYNIVLFAVLSSYTVPRYILSAAPLLLPWTVEGGAEIIRFAKRRRPVLERVTPKQIAILLAVLLIGFGVKGLGGVRHSLSGKYDAEVEVGRWLGENADMLDINHAPPPDEYKGIMYLYAAGKKLRVAACGPQYELRAEADTEILDRLEPVDSLELFTAYVSSRGADVLIEDDKFREAQPELTPQLKALKVIKNFANHEITVYLLEKP